MWTPRVIQGGKAMPLERCDCLICQAAVNALARPIIAMSPEEANDRHEQWMARRRGYQATLDQPTAAELEEREAQVEARAKIGEARASFEALLGEDGRP